MSKLCLKQQLSRRAQEIEQLVDELPPNDPIKDWFFVELDALTSVDPASTLSLDEQNCRLRGLQQLQHLVRKHHDQLGPAEDAASSQSPHDSWVQSA